MRIAMFNSFSPLREYGFKIHSELLKLSKDEIDIFYTHYDNLKFNQKNVKKIFPTKIPFFRQLLNDFFFTPLKVDKTYNLYHMTNQGCARYIKYLSKNTKTIVTIHDLGSYFNNFFSLRNFLTRKIVSFSKNADRIVAISENTKNDIINILKIPSEKIDVIYNGISHDVFKVRDKIKIRRELGIENGIKIVLHVTVDEPRKNISTILKAVQSIRNKYPNILFIRVGKHRKETEDIIKSLDLERSMKCFGYLNEKVLAKWYNVADVFVFPSSFEGFGLPPLEAMASGTPVICSNVTSLKEVIGDAALVVDPLDYKDLYEKIEILFSNKKLRDSLIKKGLKQTKKFTWNKCAKEYLKVYGRV